MVEHSGAPAGYPVIHYLTRPIRQAAAGRGDPGGMALWAGRGHSLVRPLPVGELVELLTPRPPR
jgi:nitronate monooxygenase